MRSICKHTVVFLMVAAFLTLPLASTALAQERLVQEEIGAGQMAVDFFLVRPVGFVATVLGTALFVVSLPFSYWGGNYEKAADKMVKEPARFTFKRPLGEF